MPSLLDTLHHFLREEQNVLAYDLLARMEDFLNEFALGESSWSEKDRVRIHQVKSAIGEPDLVKRLEGVKARGQGFKQLLQKDGSSVSTVHQPLFCPA